MSFPQDLTLSFDEALRSFNFVAGVVYRKDKTLSIPLYHGPQAWVCDCLQLDVGQDWRTAEIRPVRAEDVGEPFDFLPHTLKKRVAQLGRTCDVR